MSFLMIIEDVMERIVMRGGCPDMEDDEVSFSIFGFFGGHDCLLFSDGFSFVAVATQFKTLCLIMTDI